MNQTFAACKHFFQFHVLLLITLSHPHVSTIAFPRDLNESPSAPVPSGSTLPNPLVP